jgi:hypothetical protein
MILLDLIKRDVTGLPESEEIQEYLDRWLNREGGD